MILEIYVPVVCFPVQRGGAVLPILWLDLVCNQTLLDIVLVQRLPLLLVESSVQFLKDWRRLLRSPPVVLGLPLLGLLARGVEEMRHLVLYARDFTFNLDTKLDLLQAFHCAKLVAEDGTCLALAQHATRHL